MIGVKCHFQHLRSYSGGQFYRKPESPEETADLQQVTDLLPNMYVVDGKKAASFRSGK